MPLLRRLAARLKRNPEFSRLRMSEKLSENGIRNSLAQNVSEKMSEKMSENAILSERMSGNHDQPTEINPGYSLRSIAAIMSGEKTSTMVTSFRLLLAPYRSLTKKVSSNRDSSLKFRKLLIRQHHSGRSRQSINR